ncbi:hypothetical protein ACFL9U_08305 [Thermodesulfobacteriota bacterium]
MWRITQSRLLLQSPPGTDMRSRWCFDPDTTSLVSVGTEKMIVGIVKKSLLGKARARPG